MTPSNFNLLLQEYHESGLNVKDFCSNQSIAPSTFYYWKKKLGQTPQHQPDNFVPLLFDSSQQLTSDRPMPHAPLKRANSSGNHAPIELLFSNGTKMVLRDSIDMHLLKTIVHLFD